jgi:hypothetical protein
MFLNLTRNVCEFSVHLETRRGTIRVFLVCNNAEPWDSPYKLATKNVFLRNWIKYWKYAHIFECIHFFVHNYAYKKLRGLNPRANYTAEWLPLVGEASANFCGVEGVAWWARRIPRPYSRFSRPEPLLSVSSSSSSVLTRLSGSRCRLSTSWKFW